MGKSSITEVAKRHNMSRKTIAYAVQEKYLKSSRNLRNEYLISDLDADYYVNGPQFPSWWSFKQITSLGIPIDVLYKIKDQCDFKWKRWKKNLYAYIPGIHGIEGDLKAMGYLQYSKSMMQMEKPILDK